MLHLGTDTVTVTLDPTNYLLIVKGFTEQKTAYSHLFPKGNLHTYERILYKDALRQNVLDRSARKRGGLAASEWDGKRPYSSAARSIQLRRPTKTLRYHFAELRIIGHSVWLRCDATPIWGRPRPFAHSVIQLFGHFFSSASSSPSSRVIPGLHEHTEC